MLRVALIDDEPLARQAMRQLLAQIPDVEVIGEAAHAAAARELIRTAVPDAIFLDIHMPRTSGFDLLETMDSPPKVVFVTAYSEHAVRAFEVDAVDYLLKPVRLQRLQAAVRRLLIACGRDREADPALAPDDRICLSTPGRTLVAKLRHLAVLEADGDFTRIFVAGEAPLMICKTLSHYERTLPAPPFIRVDRSLILNVEAITRTERMSRDEEIVWLDGKTDPVHLGRAAQARLRAGREGLVRPI